MLVHRFAKCCSYQTERQHGMPQPTLEDGTEHTRHSGQMVPLCRIGAHELMKVRNSMKCHHFKSANLVWLQYKNTAINYVRRFLGSFGQPAGSER